MLIMYKDKTWIGNFTRRVKLFNQAKMKNVNKIKLQICIMNKVISI